MSQQYSVAEARSSLPKIIDQAEAGIEIQLTRRGKPVAAVVDLGALERLRGGRPGFRTAYRAFLLQHTLADIGLNRGSFTTVRDRSSGRKVSL